MIISGSWPCHLPSNPAAAAAAAKSLQSCPTLCDPIDTRLPRPWDSPGKNTGVACHFLLQCMKVKSESEVAQSCPTLATPWTAAYQAPLSMGFSRQEYWSGLPLPSPFLSIGPSKLTTIECFYKISLFVKMSNKTNFSLIRKVKKWKPGRYTERLIRCPC